MHKIYQQNIINKKESLQKKLLKGIKVFLKKRKTSRNMAANDTKIFMAMKNKG